MRALFVLVVAAFAVAACGGDDPDEAPSGTTTTPTAEPTPEPDADTTGPTAEPTAEPTPQPGEASSGPTAEPTAEPTAQPTATPASRATIAELVALDRPLNIAHAGGDQEAPHSTMYAYRTAVAAGADVLEADVQLSGDGVLLVQHDDTVDRTTGTTGRVDEMTFAELRELDAAYWWSPQCWRCDDLDPSAYVFRGVRTGDVPPPEGFGPDDFRIISFRELVEAFPTMALDVEIKGEYPDAAGDAEALAAEIADLGIGESVVVTSFDDDVLAAFEALAPDVATSPGVGEMTEWLVLGRPLDPDTIVQVPPRFGETDVLTADFWERVDTEGVTVWVWPNDADTQENEAFYRRLVDQGADGVIAGRPSEMAAVVASR